MMSFTQKELYALCVKCGKCRSVCPVFNELNEEGAAPRGKIALIQAFVENVIEPSSRTKRAISECLLCGACVEICPNNVQTDLLILAAREQLVKYPGHRLVESLLTKVAFSKTDLSFKLGYAAEHAIGTKIKSGTDVFYRLPVNRIIPEFKGKRFTSSDKNKYTNKTKTGFFLGCLIEFIYHNIAEDTIFLLNASGKTPYIPRNQGCCGLPALSMGNSKKAEEQARAVIRLFKDVDTVVTACASCGSMMKNYYQFLFKNPEDIREAKEFAEKVKDISEVLEPELFRGGKAKETLITYHDPCHLKRGMGIRDKPRDLIKYAGYKIAEMQNPDRCCGLGGAFNIKHRKLSLSISNKKVNDINSTGADIVATGCPGCIANISAMLMEQHSHVRVMHTVNLLAMVFTHKMDLQSSRFYVLLTNSNNTDMEK
jgi:glycolate oxidase iron-sulfur subunit